MPATKDFRAYAFDPARVDAAGKNLGQQMYWKLYAIENLVRVVIHSVLTAQVGANWWTTTVDPGLQARATNRRQDYVNRPWHSTPGKHDIYYVFLSDLNKIIAANSHLFTKLVPDIDQWIARIEQVRLPRNIVGPHELAHQDGPRPHQRRARRPTATRTEAVRDAPRPIHSIVAIKMRLTV